MTVTVQVTLCKDCSQHLPYSAIRCHVCGSDCIVHEPRSGCATVAAATRSGHTTFAVIDLASGIRLLAMSGLDMDVEIGDRVLARSRADGTVELCRDMTEGGESHETPHCPD